MKPVIFLDIDGVIYSYLTYKFIPSAIEALNVLIERTGFDVVVSSSRRNGSSVESLQKLLTDNGVRCNVIGKTPVLKGRGEEIKKWIKDHGGFLVDGQISPSTFIIIDDEWTDILPHIKWHWCSCIHTNMWRGLDMFDVAFVLGDREIAES